MHCSCLKFARISAGLLSGLLFVIMSISAGAQQESARSIGRGFGPAYDMTHETTLAGTIEQVFTNHEAGSPAGVHLLVADTEGEIDAHVGSFLSKQTKEALRVGAPVQIIGATTQLHDKQYFLVRQLTVGGQTVVIRNERGFLVHARDSEIATTRKINASDTKGGQQ